VAYKYIIEQLLKNSPKIYKGLQSGKQAVKTTADYGSKPFKAVGRGLDYVEKTKIGGPLIATGEGVIAGLGAKNVYEGIRDEDYAKAGMGIVEAGLPILQAPRTLMNISKAYTRNKRPPDLSDKLAGRSASKNVLERASEGIAGFTKPGRYVPEKVATGVALAAPEAVNLFEEAINPPLDVGSGDGKNYEKAIAKYTGELNQFASEGIVPTDTKQGEIRDGLILAKNQDRNSTIVSLEEEQDLSRDEATKFVDEVGDTENVIEAAKEIDAIKGQGPIPIEGEEVPYTPIDPQKDIKSNFNNSVTNIKKSNNSINKQLNNKEEPDTNNYNEPSDIIELFTARQNAYKEYGKAVEKIKSKMANREKQTFEQFYQQFRERAGMDVPQNDINYIIMKMGLAMMSAKTYNNGASGFLEILGQAGGQAVEEAFQLYQQERELQQNLVGNFMKYERELDMYYDEQEKDLALQQAQLGITAAEGDLDLMLKLRELDQKHKEKLRLGDREKIGDNRVYRFEGKKQIVGKDNQKTTVPDVFFAKGYQTKTGIDMITYDFVDKDKNSETYGQRLSITQPINEFREAKNAMDYTYDYESVPKSGVLNSKKLKLKYGGRTLEAIEMAFEPQVAFGGKSLLDIAGTELFLLDSFETLKGSVEGIKSFIDGQDDDYAAGTNIIGASSAEEVFSAANTDTFLSKFASGGKDGAIRIDINNDGVRSTEKGSATSVNFLGIKTKTSEVEKYNDFIEDERKLINEKLNKAKSYFEKHKNKVPVDQRLALAKALGAAVFIENQLKYAVANMNKTEDRITVQDILNAQELTQIKKLFASQAVIKEKYKAYRTQIYQTVLQEVNDYQAVTGKDRASILETFGMGKFADKILGESGYADKFEGKSTDEVLNLIKKR